MSLRLYLHPLASFCQKAIIAFYENNTPFEPHVVDLGDPASREAFQKVWPLAKFPVLRDEARGHTVAESTVIIEYLATHYPGSVALVPTDPDFSWQTRLQDRFYDFYVHEPMQKIVTDKLRPPGGNDSVGVAQARALLQTAYGMIERRMQSQTWATGEQFTMADCAAAPSLFYADRVQPLAPSFPNAAAYLARLKARPSFARVIDEAKPYFHLFPG